MAHYFCPDCKARSQEVSTEAEAEQLLGTHQRHFCRPVYGGLDAPAVGGVDLLAGAQIAALIASPRL